MALLAKHAAAPHVVGLQLARGCAEETEESWNTSSSQGQPHQGQLLPPQALPRGNQMPKVMLIQCEGWDGHVSEPGV